MLRTGGCFKKVVVKTGLTVTAFHARPYGRFIEIHSNLRVRKLMDSIFLETVLVTDFTRTTIQVRRKRQLQHLKR